jgi:hypothetical protein
MSISAHDIYAVLGAMVLAGIGGELFLKGVLGGGQRAAKPLAATSLDALTGQPEIGGGAGGLIRTPGRDGVIGRGPGFLLLAAYRISYSPP